MATINGAEGDEIAIKWLEKGGFMTLYHIARATDGYDDSKKWLIKKDKLYAALALQMEIIKDQIDNKNNDPHQINP